jgi:hypothetical protein
VTVYKVNFTVCSHYGILFIFSFSSILKYDLSYFFLMLKLVIL